MTQIQIQELEEWIAEHVMGWTVHERNTACYVRKGNKVAMMSRAEYIRSEWKPATDEAAALEVLAKCLEKVNVRMGQNRVRNSHFWICDTINLGFFAEAETLPLAICLFAKKIFMEAISR